MAEVFTYVGSFAKRSGTGFQGVGGVGFTPKAIFFWGGGATAADTGFENVNCQQLTGISDGVHSVATAHISGDGLTTSSTALGYYNTAAIVTVDLGGTLNSLATMVGFNSDGFTLEWTTAVSGTGMLIHFLAIGGDDVEARVSDVVTNSSVGAQVVTGVTFQPTNVLFLAFPATTAAPTVITGFGPNGIGLIATGTQAALDTDTVMPRNPSETTRYQRTDRAVIAQGAAGVAYEATLTSLDADGFTLNWTTARAGRLAYLALSGVDAVVGAITTPAATGQQLTTLGFQPQAVAFFSTGQAATTSIIAQNRLSIGATDGTRQRVDWSGDNNGVSPTQTARYDATTSVIALATPAAAGGSSTMNAQASLVAFEDDGFTLDWTTVDATTRQVLYLAIGTTSTSNRNLLTGNSHTVSGSDNLIAGGGNTVTGQYSEAHGQSMTVVGRRAVGFGLDGASNTLSESGKLKIFGAFEATGAVTLDDIAAPAAQTYNVVVDDTGLLSSQAIPSAGITQLTGDVTAGPGSGSQVATLANTAVTPGSYGDATNVAQFTVDAKGRLTAAANVAITSSGGGWVEGLMRTLGDGSTTAFYLPDVAESLLFASVNGAVTDPTTYTLTGSSDQITFGTAPGAAEVVTVNYVTASV